MGKTSDLISRQAAIDAIARYNRDIALLEKPGTASTDIDDYRKFADVLLCNIPSVQPERKTGKWVFVQYDNPSIGNYHCSCCRSVAMDIYDYCPNCGARM